MFDEPLDEVSAVDVEPVRRAPNMRQPILLKGQGQALACVKAVFRVAQFDVCPLDLGIVEMDSCGDQSIIGHLGATNFACGRTAKNVRGWTACLMSSNHFCSLRNALPPKINTNWADAPSAPEVSGIQPVASVHLRCSIFTWAASLLHPVYLGSKDVVRRE